METKIANLCHRKKWYLLLIELIICFYVYQAKRRQSSLPQNVSFYNRKSPSLQELTRDQWVIIDGKRSDLAKICEGATRKFIGWNIAVITEEPISLHQCIKDSAKLLSDLVHNTAWPESDRVPHLKAYFHIIQLGAKTIYIPPEFWSDKSWKSPGLKGSSGFLYQPQPGRKMGSFNYKKYFGCADAGREEEDGFQASYEIVDQEVPAVQAPIYVSSKAPNKDVLCDLMAPPISLPKGVYVDNLQVETAIFTSKAFWALFMPAFVRDFNIDEKSLHLLKMIVQKVLWTTSTRVLLWHQGPNYVSRRQKTSTDISKLSNWHNDTVKVLQNNYCTQLTPDKCLITCLTFLKDGGFISESLADVIHSWMINVGKQLFTRIMDQSHTHHSKKYFDKPPNKLNGHDYEISNQKAIKQELSKTCSQFGLNQNLVHQIENAWTKFDDVLLLVTFNKLHYDVIPFLEIAYCPFFPKMLYCGPGLPKNTKNLLDFKYRFIQYKQSYRKNFPGGENYLCVAMAMMMSYDVKGYLVISDDILITLPKFSNFPRDVIWFRKYTSNVRCDVLNEIGCTNSTNCVSIYEHIAWFGEHKTDIIRSRVSLMMKPESSAEYRCSRKLKKLTGFDNSIYWSWQDVYYIPHRMANEYIPLARHFAKGDVHMEFAVGTMFMCLDDPTKRVNLTTIYNWAPNRTQPWLFFDIFRKSHSLHPTKWSPMLKSDKGTTNFYSNSVLPYLHDPRNEMNN